MKHFAMICFVLMMGTSLALAQAQAQAQTKIEAAKPAADLPSVDTILEKYVTALGGKTAIERQTSRVIKGTFEMPAAGVSGTFVGYSKAPNKTMRVIEIGGVGTADGGFDGKVGWDRQPMQGLREQGGAELAMAKIAAEFYQPLKFKELYKKLEVKGKEKVGNVEAYLVEATPSEGGPIKMYFDTVTGLLIKQDVELDSPLGKMPSETSLEDYRVVDGIKLPFTMKMNTPAFGWVIKVEEVKHNIEIEDAKFAKPAGQ